MQDPLPQDVIPIPVQTDGPPVPTQLENILKTRGAFSQSTERARESDLAIYTGWCANHGLDALPALPATIAAFVDSMSRVRSPATVKRYVSSVKSAHRAIGHERTVDHSLVRMAKRRMYRNKGRRQVQALGITWPILKEMLVATGDRLIDARNRALLSVAYDTLLRRSELAALEVHDLSGEYRGSGTVLVRRSKTDPEGDGAVQYLARDTMALVREWLERSGVGSGKLFRSLCRGVVGNQLDPSQIPRIYKRMAKKAGLPPEVVAGLSGHSTRVGAAQDMIAVGIGMPAVMQAGRWKSTATVNRYGERLLPNNSGAAQLARIQHRD